MPYTDAESVREVLGGVGDTATAASLPDPDILNAIEEAQAEVDARVSGAPWGDEGGATTAPQIVQLVTQDVAAYLATLRHRRGDPLPGGHPVLLRYQRAHELLGEMAKGNLEVGPEDEATASGSAAVVNAWSGNLWEPSDLGMDYGAPRAER